LFGFLGFFLLLSSTIDDASSTGNELYADQPICSSYLHVILVTPVWAVFKGDLNVSLNGLPIFEILFCLKHKYKF